MASRRVRCIIGVGIFLVSCAVASAQGNAAPVTVSAKPLTVTPDYPSELSGVLIEGSHWKSIEGEGPTKSHIKHGFAPAFTYGIAPAAIVSDYKGPHAQVHVNPGRPEICVCHFSALPGDPVLVKLHVKKGMRELDGGKLHIGAKLEEAEKSDLVAVNVSKPEDMVWLVQPQKALSPGEYALMLGTQNIVIFPFTVDGEGTSGSAAK
jgi:hypothetical protein